MIRGDRLLLARSAVNFANQSQRFIQQTVAELDSYHVFRPAPGRVPDQSAAASAPLSERNASCVPTGIDCGVSSDKPCSETSLLSALTYFGGGTAPPTRRRMARGSARGLPAARSAYF